MRLLGIRSLVIDSIVDGLGGAIAKEALEELEDDDLDSAVNYILGHSDYLPSSILRLLPSPLPARPVGDPDGGARDILSENWTTGDFEVGRGPGPGKR